jgi:hypothetical protein
MYRILFLKRPFCIRVFVMLLMVKLCQAQSMPALAPNYLSFTGTSHEIPFIWKADSMGNTINPHAALLLPVTLPGCPRQFYMQFDLGAPSSLFYKNKLAAIAAQYPNAVRVADSSTQLTNFRFRVGRTELLAAEIILRPLGTTGISGRPKAIDIIGTIGADFIENKVVIINYPLRKILVTDTILNRLGNVILSDMIVARRSILLPSIIKGKKTMLYFDTGSSAFELLTDKNTCLSLAAPNATPTIYKVTSWDRMLTANTYSTGDSIAIAAASIPLHNVTYIDGASDAQINRMMQMGIGGMTGNKLFINHTLVLDTKNKKFGIAPSVEALPQRLDDAKQRQ